MKMKDMATLAEEWAHAIAAAKDATYLGTKKELQAAWIHCAEVSERIQEAGFDSADHMIEQMSTWRNV